MTATMNTYEVARSVWVDVPGSEVKGTERTVVATVNSENGFQAMLDWAASEKAGHYVRGTTKADWKRPDVARSVGGEAGV